MEKGGGGLTLDLLDHVHAGDDAAEDGVLGLGALVEPGRAGLEQIREAGRGRGAETGRGGPDE